MDFYLPQLDEAEKIDELYSRPLDEADTQAFYESDQLDKKAKVSIE